MRRFKWVFFSAALGLMAATAGLLAGYGGRHLLGKPGVKVGPVSIYGSDGRVVANQGVLLPEMVDGIPSRPMPITETELGALPEDTTFGRRRYLVQSNGFPVQATVVLMGTDHTSIHQPQYCLYAQGWNITNTERITLRMEKPYAYDIPAVKLTATEQFATSNGPVTLDCFYVYWFVSGDESDQNKITAEEGSRLWSGWMNTLKKGEIERWAYISYFAACYPGNESVTLRQLERLIRASVPEFQLVAGEPVDRPGQSEARK